MRTYENHTYVLLISFCAWHCFNVEVRQIKPQNARITGGKDHGILQHLLYSKGSGHCMSLSLFFAAAIFFDFLLNNLELFVRARCKNVNKCGPFEFGWSKKPKKRNMGNILNIFKASQSCWSLHHQKNTLDEPIWTPGANPSSITARCQVGLPMWNIYHFQALEVFFLPTGFVAPNKSCIVGPCHGSAGSLTRFHCNCAGS